MSTVAGGSQYEKHGRSHYERNKEAYLARNQNKREEIRQYLRDFKLAAGCVDCGFNSHYAALDFDHVEAKTVAPTQMATRLWSYERINKELAKCEVRCANCHRIVTWERAQCDIGVEVT